MTKKSIHFDCPHCHSFLTLVLENQNENFSFPCGFCQKDIELKRLDQELLHACPVCNNSKLYQHKDFNKTLGIIIFVIGVIFSFWTYHLSLIAALIVDAALYPFFPWMNVCYKCHAEMRGWPKNPELDRFNHEVASHYEYVDENKKAKS